MAAVSWIFTNVGCAEDLLHGFSRVFGSGRQCRFQASLGFVQRRRAAYTVLSAA
jgi:hypothetical protein